MKILFQGDSITDAFRKPEEINQAFQLGNGYVFLIAAQLASESPALPREFINRGISGQGVQGLRHRWERDALALAPYLLSLLIGVNDTIFFQRGGSQLGDAEFADHYRWLVDSLRQTNPALKMVLLEPFLLPVGDVLPAWIAHLRPRQTFIRHYAAEVGAVFIPLQTIFTEACRRAPAAFWAFDGIHPTHAGFHLMAEVWLKAARPLLPALPQGGGHAPAR